MIKKILALHIEAVLQAAQDSTGDVVIAHDTTEFKFTAGGEREGLGFMSDNNRVFFAHVGLAAIVSDGHLNPLGVAGSETNHRSSLVMGRVPVAQKQRDKGNEHLRWARQILAPDILMRAQGVDLVHLADSEAGSWENFLILKQAECRFIMRTRPIED